MRRDDAMVPLAEIEAAVPVEYPCRPVGTEAAAGRPAESVRLDRVRPAEEREQSKTGTRDFKQLRVRRCPVPFSAGEAVRLAGDTQPP